MGRRVTRLTLDNLGDLPGHCTECLFWELSPVQRARVRGHEREEKAAWVSAVLREWGSCGRVLYVDEEYAGHLLWAPPVHVPGAAGFATAPVSGDAVLLTTGYVVPAQRGGGLGRVLVQSMAKDLLRRGGIRAIEAFGDTRGSDASCVLPSDFLLAVGFATQRPHATQPRMRMDLRTTVSWRSELEAALEKLLSPVLPKRVPRPVRPTPRSSTGSPREAE
ncbi:MAG: GNAT family N-acetyltransferase [Marmoricola sp.]